MRDEGQYEQEDKRCYPGPEIEAEATFAGVRSDDEGQGEHDGTDCGCNTGTERSPIHRALTTKVTGADETLAITCAADRRPVDRRVCLTATDELSPCMRRTLSRRAMTACAPRARFETG